MRPPRLAWSAVALAALPLLHGAAELDAQRAASPRSGAARRRRGTRSPRPPRRGGARYVGVWSMAGSNNRRAGARDRRAPPRTSPTARLLLCEPAYRSVPSGP